MDKELHIDRKEIEELVLYTRRFFLMTSGWHQMSGLKVRRITSLR